jgi:hypothetical protein
MNEGACRPGGFGKKIEGRGRLGATAHNRPWTLEEGRDHVRASRINDPDPIWLAGVRVPLKIPFSLQGDILQGAGVQDADFLRGFDICRAHHSAHAARACAQFPGSAQACCHAAGSDVIDFDFRKMSRQCARWGEGARRRAGAACFGSKVLKISARRSFSC